MSDAKLSFDNKEEFRAACNALGRRLHYLNRVAMGEQRFVWEVAVMMEKLGRVFEDHYDDKDTAAQFGDGYTKGSIEKEDAAIALFAMMYPDRK